MANADAQLTSSLSRLSINVEAYPNLKADQSFIRLQDELTGTEKSIAVSRNDYNQAVQQYNAYIANSRLCSRRRSPERRTANTSRRMHPRSRDRPPSISQSRRRRNRNNAAPFPCGHRTFLVPIPIQPRQIPPFRAERRSFPRGT